jgi:hypothetical protein
MTRKHERLRRTLREGRHERAAHRWRRREVRRLRQLIAQARDRQPTPEEIATLVALERAGQLDVSAPPRTKPRRPRG